MRQQFADFAIHLDKPVERRRTKFWGASAVHRTWNLQRAAFSVANNCIGVDGRGSQHCDYQPEWVGAMQSRRNGSDNDKGRCAGSVQGYELHVNSAFSNGATQLPLDTLGERLAVTTSCSSLLETGTVVAASGERT